MKIIKKPLTYLILLQVAILNLKAHLAQAAPTSSALTRFRNVAGGAGYSTVEITPATIIIRFLMVAMSFLGIIFLIVIIYSGFQWMTAGGEEEKVKQAQGRIKNAVIGLAIVLLSYSFTVFIYNNLFKSTNTCYFCF
jgi:hypothetical protein